MKWHTFDDCDLEPAEQELLAVVGFPSDDTWSLDFERPKNERRTLNHKASNYLIVAYDDVMPIAINLNSRELWCLEESVRTKAKDRFVNSNLQNFLKALAVFQRYRLAVRTMDSDDEADLIAAATSEDLHRLEPRLIDDSEAYWRLISEQIQAGLL